MRYLLALDQGTTSSRAILFRRDGSVRAVARQEYPQIYPQPGWVEHRPDDILHSQRQVIDTVLAELSAGESVVAVGITNQRETTLLWDRQTGAPIGNAIVWQDRRTADRCDRLARDGYGPLIAERTGLVPDPYFSGTKLEWLLDRDAETRSRAENGDLAFGTVDSWLIWNLTGGERQVTDVTNASRTLLMNLHTPDWDEEMLALLRIPRAVLPEIVASSGIVGEIRGIPGLAGVPIAGIAGDQQAALFGQRCFEPGMAKNTYGTGCFLLMNTGETPRRSENGLLTTVAWRLGEEKAIYAQEGSVFIAGAVVQWLRDGLGLISTSADSETLAASVPDNGGVYFVPAFSGLGAPTWDPYARGTIVGLTRGTTAGHIARAALEAIAFQSYDVLKAMERDAGTPLRELRVDGGASRNDLLMQFQADLLQTPVVRPAMIETTALGAAYLAGLAVGFLPDRAELAEQPGNEQRFLPRRTAGETERMYAAWREAVDRSRDWARQAAP
ncbi:MAG: glycerol kinase GlpK [Capsulimonadales bacterium]|nr:glycerol kinase GlpK [Capsulimonadales bacterium]